MKALIFDLDGVVADTAPAHFASWARLADELDLQFDHQRFRLLLGRTREDSLDLLLDGRAINARRSDLLARKQTYFLESLAAMGPDDALPGIPALLDEAQRAGMVVALASSSRNALGVLDQLGLNDRFAVIADGNSVVRPKPAPDIFLHVAERLGIAPRDALVIEDSSAGAEAARAGGFALVTVGPEPLSSRHVATLAGVTLAELVECEAA